MPHVPGQKLAEEAVGAIKRKFAEHRREQGLTDEFLMEKAAKEFGLLRKGKKNADKMRKNQPLEVGQASPDHPSGVIVLGMHRSGTSMLSGLMSLGMSYKVGGPLIGGAFDNPKGFFELLPVVLQNDAFMKAQKIWWAAGVKDYDPKKALSGKENSLIDFKEHGQPALKFLNDPDSVPYLQKDPRMCITLKTWLPLLNHKPAVLFTYRHPMEVALSLKKREKNFPLEHGLRLWIIYNMRAIQNSEDLCRVLSSNEAILNDPLGEIQRIGKDLTEKCNLPPPPKTLKQSDVDKFIDPALQHNRKQRQAEEANKKVLVEYDDCRVPDYDSDAPADSAEYEREHSLYLRAMRIYCDFGSGKAYEKGYEWPDL